MIASKIIQSDHLVQPNNKYIVDTNVLIDLYGNKQIDSRAGRIMIQALDVGCDVFIPAVVVSEFVKVFHKNEFDRMQSRANKRGVKTRLRFKEDYQNTKAFNDNNRFIQETLEKNIFSRCKQISDGFSEYSYKDVMATGSNQTFNDNLIIKIANQNDLYVLSRDTDTKKIRIK